NLLSTLGAGQKVTLKLFPFDTRQITVEILIDQLVFSNRQFIVKIFLRNQTLFKGRRLLRSRLPEEILHDRFLFSTMCSQSVNNPIAGSVDATLYTLLEQPANPVNPDP